MAVRCFGANALNGGAAGALDAILQADYSMLTGDKAVVIIDNTEVIPFTYDAAAVDAEDAANHPYKIRPDDVGWVAGVWIEDPLLGTGASPVIAGLDLTGITDSNIPYMSAAGFADSPLTTDGTDVTSSGNLILPDDGTIGSEAGTQITFDSTDDEIKLTADLLTLDLSAQDYAITQRSSLLILQGLLTGNASGLEIFSNDGDGTDTVLFYLYGVGVPSDINTARERLQILWNSGTSAYEIFTEAKGTGTLRPLVLYTDGNANQLVLNTDGTIDLSGDVTIADGKKIKTDKIEAYDSAGLQLVEDGGLGIAIADSTGEVSIAPGVLHIGTEDTTQGKIFLYGHGASNVNGGQIFFFTAADYDTTIEYYRMKAYADDFQIGRNIGVDFKIDSNGIVSAPQVYAHDMNGETIRDLQINDSGELGYDSGSSRRPKSDIQMYPDTSYVLTIPVYSYMRNGQMQIGPLAEDTAALCPPEITGWGYEYGEYAPEWINEKKLIYPMLNELQRLRDRVEWLEQQQSN